MPQIVDHAPARRGEALRFLLDLVVALTLLDTRPRYPEFHVGILRVEHR